ncbi:MAG: phosphoadenosine phosphosulfate reductase family protein [Chthonomonadales bacterium]|nr:phosphoadenosine phosphosulfate reductase family protein [Chthonomonadales bacterium]
MTSVRHILSLSGGKDSSALAVYMRERVPEMEYVFCDTGKELPETYEYLDRLEAYLGKQIVRLSQANDAFDRLLEVRRGYLPSPSVRWCTELLKIRPFEQYVGNDPVINYIGIRADENRKAYISTKPNITARYPFIEDGIDKDGVGRLLRESGLGLPSYYGWRSRSGCYFCFFQQRIEWVGLLENHPDLFEQAAGYEKEGPDAGRRYTWSGRESLRELARPERVLQIKQDFDRRQAACEGSGRGLTLGEILTDEMETRAERPCLICEL